jgi:hypothetical protein
VDCTYHCDKCNGPASRALDSLLKGENMAKKRGKVCLIGYLENVAYVVNDAQSFLRNEQVSKDDLVELRQIILRMEGEACLLSDLVCDLENEIA